MFQGTPKPRVQVISDKAPTEPEQAQNVSLVTHLQALNLYENAAQNKDREYVLASLNEIVSKWCKKVFQARVSNFRFRVPFTQLS